jgi:hypothetical protein
MNLKETIEEKSVLRFWHGGNLENNSDNINHKSGRYEYGPGLYLITHYETALKYSKGSRKLYLISVEVGVDIDDVVLNINDIRGFINNFVITNKKKLVWDRLQKYTNDNTVRAFIFNNILINEEAIKPSNTSLLRKFFIEKGIDYQIVDNPYGWGEKMMVLYNMNKIVDIKIVTPKDKITEL